MTVTDKVTIKLDPMQLYLMSFAASDMLHNLIITYEEWTGSDDQKKALLTRIDEARQLKAVIRGYVDKMEGGDPIDGSSEP